MNFFKDAKESAYTKFEESNPKLAAKIDESKKKMEDGVEKVGNLMYNTILIGIFNFMIMIFIFCMGRDFKHAKHIQIASVVIASLFTVVYA